MASARSTAPAVSARVGCSTMALIARAFSGATPWPPPPPPPTTQALALSTPEAPVAPPTEPAAARLIVGAVLLPVYGVGMDVGVGLVGRSIHRVPAQKVVQVRSRNRHSIAKSLAECTVIRQKGVGLGTDLKGATAQPSKLGHQFRLIHLLK